MKIYNTCKNNINFGGLNKQLSKEIYKKENIKIINNVFSKSNGIVGNLPPQWINNIPPKERKINIKSLYLDLGNLIIKTSRYRTRNFGKEYSHEIEFILKKYKAIKQDSKINIEYIDQGAYSYGFKIENKNENYNLFLKLFREESPYDTIGHGQYSECNTKMFLKKHLNKNDKLNFSKFYYGDINNGYYIEEFLSSKNSLLQFPSQIKNDKIQNLQKILEKLNLYHYDCNESNYKIYYPNNKYKMVLFDCGGIRKLK